MDLIIVNWLKNKHSLWSVINREMKMNTYNRHLLELNYVIIIIIIVIKKKSYKLFFALLLLNACYSSE